MWYGRSWQWPFMIGYHSNWQSTDIRQKMAPEFRANRSTSVKLIVVHNTVGVWIKNIPEKTQSRIRDDNNKWSHSIRRNLRSLGFGAWIGCQEVVKIPRIQNKPVRVGTPGWYTPSHNEQKNEANVQFYFDVLENVMVCSHRTTPSLLTGGTFDLWWALWRAEWVAYLFLPVKRYGDGDGVVWCEWSLNVSSVMGCIGYS